MKSKLRKVQFNYLDYVFDNMYSYNSKHYPDSTFFKKNDRVILEFEKSGTLWVLYSIWSNISDMFSLDYYETQQLIKEWMEEKLKLVEVKPDFKVSQYNRPMEEQIKSREVEPIPEHFFYKPLMEEQLKSVEIKPLDAGSNYLPFMERQLKHGEVIACCCFKNKFRRVEEQIKSGEITPHQLHPIKQMEGYAQFLVVEEQIKLGEIKPHLGHTYEMGKINEEF